MKNENVHMQALHQKLDVVLVQILRYNCSETDYSFCEDSPQQDSAVYPDAGFTRRPLQPSTIFSLRRPSKWLIFAFFKSIIVILTA